MPLKHDEMYCTPEKRIPQPKHGLHFRIRLFRSLSLILFPSIAPSYAWALDFIGNKQKHILGR